MAKKIAGITIEIGGNTAPLNKALAGVNKTSKDLQSELKQVDRLLKLDPKNTELMAQKQKLLTEAVKNTGDKLNTLKEAQKQVNEQFAKGEISEDQYRAFQREIVKTEQDLKKLETQLGQVNDKWKESADRLKDFGDKTTSLGKSMLPATAAITGLGAAALKFASDEQEALNKTQASFKDASKEVEVFAETSLKTYGIAKGTALDMAALFGDMGTSMGLTTSEAAKMSTELVGLAGDLASFKNIGLDQAQTALKAIFTGETESLKNLGVVMTQTNLDAFALANGFRKTTKEMSESEKVMLRYQYVMEATKNAQGDFAKNAGDSLAVNLTIAKESAKELAASFGEQLIPVIVPLIQKLTDLIQRVGGLDEGTKRMIIVILGLVAAIAPTLIILGTMAGAISKLIALHATYTSWLAGSTLATKIWSSVTAAATAAGKAFGAVLTFLTGPIGIAIIAITALIAAGVLLYKNWEKVVEFAKKMWDGLKDIFTKIKDFVIGIWDGIVQGIKDRVNKAIEFINGMITALNKLKVKMPDFMGGKTIGFNIKEIPMLAEGGRAIRDGLALVGERGPEIVKLTQGAEVVPLDKAGIGNVNVYVQADDLQQMADVVRLFNGLRQTARQGV